ncbi:flavin-containing monooxygenase [Peribacillus asahii]|uniref:flavin-containing monooxygenase n=1 Tax=Peribacillus asahii TaxID=228899 RepID=UPI002202A818|nr:NAD(P)/FAD-dependent oxidoreductase [Peribacillus asahii]USK62469.1 NAD(P)/FAD-dependent oxidoreductase [Peribacillus asahii]
MILDAIVVGAGQAGLSMGYWLSKSNYRFIIIDGRTRIGDTWRKRYDSLTLFTPRCLSALPGLALKGKPQGFPTKDEIADYLEQYALTFDLPIQMETEVISMDKQDDIFFLTTTKGTFQTRQVTIATGPFQTPFIPEIAKNLSPKVFQIHSSSYREPSQLKSGNTVIVGGGNSGGQITVEIASKKKVFLSVGQKPRYLPLSIFGKSTFWWFNQIGLLKVNRDSIIGQKIRSVGDPIFGFELKNYIRDGKITILPRTIKCEEQTLRFLGGEELEIQNIIWATGFKSSYHWIQIPYACDERGNPIHHRGVSNVAGLYFLGRPWQNNRSSALLTGVGSDAEYLSQVILCH